MGKFQVSLVIEAEALFEVPGILNREKDFLKLIVESGGSISPLDAEAFTAVRRAIELLS